METSLLNNTKLLITEDVVESGLNSEIFKMAEDYISKGFAPIPIPHGEKGPILKGWPTLKINIETIPNYFSKINNIGLKLGKCSGGLIDIDLDCEEAKPFTYFLPPTAMVHGRSGNLSSHFWYLLAEDIPKTRQFKDIDGSMLVELRSTGGQTLVPPSIHPDGEKLEWNSEGDPAHVAKEDILSSVSKMAAGALLSRHWPHKGSRNDASLALAGMLLRNGWEDAVARNFIERVAKTAADEEWEDRGKTVDSTRKNMNEGQATTGIPKLKMLLDEKVVSRACDWLQMSNLNIEDDILQAVEQLNKRHAIVIVAGKTCVLNEEFDPEFERPTISLSTITDFKNRYLNRKIKTGGATRSSVGKVWLEHPRRRQYEGIAFDPDGALDKYFNLFKGFLISPTKGSSDLYWNHVREVICSENEELYLYVRKWMAHSIQNPSELPGIAIVLRGKQGTGKGVFVDTFGRLFGNHYLSVFSMVQVTGRFNSHMKNLLLLHANEAIWGGDKSAEGALKGLITDPHTPIEFKGKDIINVRNYKRIIVSSNEDWAVPMGSDDRRFLVLDVSDAHKEDESWFGPIIKQMKEKGLEALMYDLKNEDLTDFNVRKPPKSGFGFDMKLRSLNTVHQWLYEFLCSGEITYKYDKAHEFDLKWDSTPVKNKLHKSYQDWCSNNKKNHPATQAAFTTTLKKIFHDLGTARKKSYDGIRKYFYILPDFKESRLLFEKHTKSDSNIWPTVTEVNESEDDIEEHTMDIEDDF